MQFYAFLALCFIPLVAAFVVLALVVPGLTVRGGLLSCLLAILAIVPTAFVQYVVLALPVFTAETFGSLLVTAVVFNGLIEETVKLLFLALMPQKRTTLAAFFSCCLLFGLTLGGFESVIYLVRRIQAVGMQQDVAAALRLVLMRMGTAALVHTFCAGLSGLYLWLFRHGRNAVMPFVWAALLHGVYNFFAAFSTGFRWFSLVAIVFALLECRIWYKTADEISAPLP